MAHLICKLCLLCMSLTYRGQGHLYQAGYYDHNTDLYMKYCQSPVSFLVYTYTPLSYSSVIGSTPLDPTPLDPTPLELTLHLLSKQSHYGPSQSACNYRA